MKFIYNSIKIIGALGAIFSIYWWFTDSMEALVLLAISIIILGVGLLVEFSEKTIATSNTYIE